MSNVNDLCQAVPALAAAFNWVPVAAAAPIALILGFVFGRKTQGKTTKKKGVKK